MALELQMNMIHFENGRVQEVPSPTGDISHKLMTVEASRYLGSLSRSGRDKILGLASGADQELKLRQAWSDAGDIESLSSHDAARALQGLSDFYNEDSKRDKDYSFPLYGATKYHWLVESKFRAGLGLVVKKLTGYENCELPMIDQSMSAEDLIDYDFRCNAIGLIVVNNLLFAPDDHILMSQYSFQK